MKQRSAGLLLFRRTAAVPEFFLVHPGGPYWAKKDEGVWSIPKGLFSEGEAPLDAAKREFGEETGLSVDGEFVALGEFRQPGGKVISAWMVEADRDARAVKSNYFSIEWPPRSGKLKRFPEVDRAAWFAEREAFANTLRGQKPILEHALGRLGIGEHG